MSKNKLYNLHALELECIIQGKAHKFYEFGVKVSLAVTKRSKIVPGCMALVSHEYEAQILKKALEQMNVPCLSGKSIAELFVDRAQRGHDELESWVSISEKKRGSGPLLRRCMKARQGIESIIGDLKTDTWLGQKPLTWSVGDHIKVPLILSFTVPLTCIYCSKL